MSEDWHLGFLLLKRKSDGEGAGTCQLGHPVVCTFLWMTIE